MHTAYLDIETAFDGSLTVIGVYRPQRGTLQLIRPEISPVNLLDALGETVGLKTYNGARFDLPVIRRQLGLDLGSLYEHEDLMFRCWRHGLKGGLKAVERQLGIVRATAGVDGLAAMSLWSRWQSFGDRQALALLLDYNREDVELLAEVENRLDARERVS